MAKFMGIIDRDGETIEVTVEADTAPEAAEKIRWDGFWRRGDKLRTPVRLDADNA